MSSAGPIERCRLNKSTQRKSRAQNDHHSSRSLEDKLLEKARSFQNQVVTGWEVGSGKERPDTESYTIGCISQEHTGKLTIFLPSHLIRVPKSAEGDVLAALPLSSPLFRPSAASPLPAAGRDRRRKGRCPSRDRPRPLLVVFLFVSIYCNESVGKGRAHGE